MNRIGGRTAYAMLVILVRLPTKGRPASVNRRAFDFAAIQTATAFHTMPREPLGVVPVTPLQASRRTPA
jgi:hypothetical protein